MEFVGTPIEKDTSVWGPNGIFNRIHVKYEQY